MTTAEQALARRAEALRTAFDHSFAEPLVTSVEPAADLIALRIDGESHAIRMRDINGLFADVKITPCPSPMPELKGLAGFRGAVTPVYDLARLLGRPPTAGRWTVLAGDASLAFAFDEFEGHFRLPVAAIVAQSGPPRTHVREIARRPGATAPVIDIPALVAAIRQRVAALASRKEQ